MSENAEERAFLIISEVKCKFDRGEKSKKSLKLRILLPGFGVCKGLVGVFLGGCTLIRKSKSLIIDLRWEFQ